MDGSRELEELLQAYGNRGKHKPRRSVPLSRPAAHNRPPMYQCLAYSSRSQAVWPAVAHGGFPDINDRYPNNNARHVRKTRCQTGGFPAATTVHPAVLPLPASRWRRRYQPQRNLSSFSAPRSEMLPVLTSILCPFCFIVNINKDHLCCLVFVFVYFVKELCLTHPLHSRNTVAKRPFFSL
ncbi:hypothetical protein D3C81_1447620 [compost metagenome]